MFLLIYFIHFIEKIYGTEIDSMAINHFKIEFNQMSIMSFFN